MFARPTRGKDGSINLLTWECGIPGKKGSPWEGGLYKLVLYFSSSYPTQPPEVYFTPPLFHPNIYSDGAVCLSILDSNKSWKPSIGIPEIMAGLQELLANPNGDDPTGNDCVDLFLLNRTKYWDCVRQQAYSMRPLEND